MPKRPTYVVARALGMALAACATLALPARPAFAGAPQPLQSADIAALVAPPAKGSKVIALWALDCSYCEQNLSALLQWQRQHKDVSLVFVATDPVSQAPALEARLKAAHLDSVPSRAYASATPDRINFLLDPDWAGETPRTLVVHADGSRKAVSGALTEERIASLVR